MCGLGGGRESILLETREHVQPRQLLVFRESTTNDATFRHGQIDTLDTGHFTVVVGPITAAVKAKDSK